VGYGERAQQPPPQKIFGLFILKSRYLVHSEVLFKVYIPIFACQFCDRKGASLLWLDDEGYKLRQAIRQLHVDYLHKLRTYKKILILLLIIKSLKNA